MPVRRARTITLRLIGYQPTLDRFFSAWRTRAYRLRVATDTPKAVAPCTPTGPPQRGPGLLPSKHGLPSCAPCPNDCQSVASVRF